MVKVIKDTNEITGKGQYCFYWMDEVITIDQELNHKDELEFCIAIGNFYIPQGWRAKTWKTIQGIQGAISDFITHQEHGLYPEPPKSKMTLDELKKAAAKRGITL